LAEAGGAPPPPAGRREKRKKLHQDTLAFQGENRETGQCAEMRWKSHIPMPYGSFRDEHGPPVTHTRHRAPGARAAIFGSRFG
jgi:hypothetical protein